MSLAKLGVKIIWPLCYSRIFFKISRLYTNVMDFCINISKINDKPIPLKVGKN